MRKSNFDRRGNTGIVGTDDFLPMLYEGGIQIPVLASGAAGDLIDGR